MHVMRGRPEIAERHGAGHVARCTVERLMADLGLPRHPPCQVPAHHAQRAARAVPGRPRRKAFQRVQAERAVGRRHSPTTWEVPPPTCVRSPGGSTSPSSPMSSRGESWAGRPPTGLHTNLALDALQMAVWQQKRQGADLTGLVHHLRPWGAVQVHSLWAGPGRLRGSRLCRL